MSLMSLLDLPAGLQVVHIDRRENGISIDVVSTAPQATCPGCQQLASRIPSHYTRKVTDLCCAGQRVELLVHVRKFFCQTADCSRKIFCERLAPFLEPWARVTSRLSGVIEAVGLGTCGSPAVPSSGYYHLKDEYFAPRHEAGNPVLRDSDLPWH